METTFQARIGDKAFHPVLDAVADLYARTQHRLYVDRHVHGLPLADLKREYIRRFGLTARQFKAIAFDLAGRVSSLAAVHRNRIAGPRRTIEAATRAIAARER